MTTLETLNEAILRLISAIGTKLEDSAEAEVDCMLSRVFLESLALTMKGEHGRVILVSIATLGAAGSAIRNNKNPLRFLPELKEARAMIHRYWAAESLAEENDRLSRQPDPLHLGIL